MGQFEPGTSSCTFVMRRQVVLHELCFWDHEDARGTGCLGTSQGGRLGILQINGLSMWVSNDSPLVRCLMIASGVLGEQAAACNWGVPAQLSLSQ